jgi:uncharacterized damage-inducible protein DinB
MEEILMKDSLFLDACRMNYEAIFKMLDEIIKLCPDELWNVRTDESPFWQQLYHTIFYTDFYISEAMWTFKKPTFAEEKANDLAYVASEAPTREQMQSYLEEAKKNCMSALEKMTPEQLEGENPFHWTGPTPAHRLVYNIRHTQHHVGWLNSMLARKTGKSAEWVI